MSFPWQKYETEEHCRWCGGQGMHTRDDLGEHPDDVGRMFRCRICTDGKMPKGTPLATYAQIARERWSDPEDTYPEAFLRELETRQ